MCCVGLLHTGDLLLEVNGNPVEGLEPEQVIQILVRPCLPNSLPNSLLTDSLTASLTVFLRAFLKASITASLTAFPKGLP